jgi:hypothetical protein
MAGEQAASKDESAKEASDDSNANVMAKAQRTAAYSQMTRRRNDAIKAMANGTRDQVVTAQTHLH